MRNHTRYAAVCAFLIAFALLLGGGCRKKKKKFYLLPENVPVVSTIPDQIATIGIPFNFDLAPFVSDVEDNNSDLIFEVTSGEGLFTGSVYSNTFLNEGNSLINFSVTDLDCNTAFGSFLVSVSGVLAADFAADNRAGTVPHTVNFTDNSSGLISSYAWDLDGDGAPDSAEQNPQFIYTSAGAYSVSLTVTGPWGSDNLIKVDYIRVFSNSTSLYYVDNLSGNDSNDGVSWGNAFKSIQKALDCAPDYGAILVADGTYTGDCNTELIFYGKPLTLSSIDLHGTGSAIIDIQNSGRAVNFINFETGETIIERFTILNGNVPDMGGAIYCDNSSPSIKHCVFENNYSANFGGAIYCYDNSNPRIENCQLMNNTALNRGGGIYCELNCAPAVIRCLIDSNVVEEMYPLSGSGAGICCFENSNATVSDCNIRKNRILVETTGCGIAADYSDLVIDNCIFSDNRIYHESGVIAGAGCALGTRFTNTMVRDCLFEDHTARTGAAIYCAFSNISILSCVFDHNNAASWGGSGRFDTYCNLAIDNCIVRNNYASSASGFYIQDNSNAVITNCLFDNNTYSYQGGCLLFAGGVSEVRNCVMQNTGYFYSPDAGAIFLGGDVTVDNCTMINNGAEYGGAVLVVNCRSTFINCIIDNNSAEWCGGGVFIRRDALATFINCRITHNTAGRDGGGLWQPYDINQSVSTYVNCTIANNTAVEKGGGLFLGDLAVITMNNSILNNNTSLDGDGHEIYFDGTLGVLNLNYCDYFPLIMGTGTLNTQGCIQTGPGFVSGFRLSPTSPCIDMGYNPYITDTGITTDLDGNLRIIDGNTPPDGDAKVDIGAYEYQP